MTRLIDADALLEAIKADRYTNAQDAIFFITNAPTVQREGWVSVPPSIFMTIARLLDNEIGLCAGNGANSVSMPDDLVELAAWLHAAPTDTE